MFDLSNHPPFALVEKKEPFPTLVREKIQPEVLWMYLTDQSLVPRTSQGIAEL